MTNRNLLIGLVVGIFTIMTSCSGDSEHTLEISGTPIDTLWVPHGSHELPPVGTGSAYYAERLFWDTFHGRDYAGTPELFKQLYAALDNKDNDPFSIALMYGRLGWAYLWIYSEFQYAQAISHDSLLVLNSRYIKMGRDSLRKADIKPITDSYIKKHPNYPGIQMASYFIGKASNLIMDTTSTSPSQLQYWFPAAGTTDIPGSQIAWPTFPAVLTGFYASFDSFPPINTPHIPKDSFVPPNKTIEMSTSEMAISGSKAFNFATPVFGTDAPQGTLGAKDLKLMIQMIQLGAHPDVVAATVPGNSSSNSKRSKAYIDMYSKLKTFYKNNPRDTTKGDITLYPPDSLYKYWNEPLHGPYPGTGSTPARIAKASSGTSEVVTYNFENNFMLLGDTYVATYTDTINWQLPSNIATIVKTSYETAETNKDVFDYWPYNNSIFKRKDYLNKGQFDSLYHMAQNDALSTYRYPACMVCHQRGNYN